VIAFCNDIGRIGSLIIAVFGFGISTPRRTSVRTRVWATFCRQSHAARRRSAEQASRSKTTSSLMIKALVRVARKSEPKRTQAWLNSKSLKDASLRQNVRMSENQLNYRNGWIQSASGDRPISRATQRGYELMQKQFTHSLDLLRLSCPRHGRPASYIVTMVQHTTSNRHFTMPKTFEGAPGCSTWGRMRFLVLDAAPSRPW